MFITTIGIDGMMCGQCEGHVCELLRKIDGAWVVKASRIKKKASLYSPRAIGKEEVEKALEGSGYRLLSHQTSEREKETFAYRLKRRKYQKPSP